MCGLVGFISSFNNGFFQKDVDAFKQMLYVDALRGEDATGICLVNNEHGALVLKEATESQYFLEEGKVEKALKESTKSGKAMLGHNRKATIGGKKDANAHPFCFDDRYVFFHNGTLHSHKHFANTEVDSEAFGQHIVACNGDVDAIADVLAKAQGAWACVWYDSVKHTVYFMRNSQRPLNFIKTKGGDIAYASESWMAAGCLTRNTMMVDEIKPAAEGMLYSIDLTKLALTIEETPIPKKAPAPVTTISTPTGAVSIKGQISRKAAKVLAAELSLKRWIGFFVDEVVCQHINPSPYQAYTYLIQGHNPEHKGVIYRAVVPQLFDYEAQQLLSNYTFGKYQDSEYSNGALEVLVDEIYKMDEKHAC